MSNKKKHIINRNFIGHIIYNLLIFFLLFFGINTILEKNEKIGTKKIAKQKANDEDIIRLRKSNLNNTKKIANLKTQLAKCQSQQASINNFRTQDVPYIVLHTSTNIDHSTPRASNKKETTTSQPKRTKDFTPKAVVLKRDAPKVDQDKPVRHFLD